MFELSQFTSVVFDVVAASTVAASLKGNTWSAGTSHSSSTAWGAPR